MGPWYHGQWTDDGSYLGNIQFGVNTSLYYQDSIFIPFLNHYLLGTAASHPDKATIFFSGENTWKKFDQWPPKNITARNLYLADNFGLVLDKTPSGKNAYDQYVSDPQKPVPYTSGIHFKRTGNI